MNEMFAEKIVLPADIKLEIFFALSLSLITIVLMQTGNLKKTRLLEATGESTKSYEKALHQHKSSSLRNL